MKSGPKDDGETGEAFAKAENPVLTIMIQNAFKMFYYHEAEQFFDPIVGIFLPVFIHQAILQGADKMFNYFFLPSSPPHRRVPFRSANDNL